MKREPRPRKDGRCIICNKLIVVAKPADADAFCSAVCCRDYFGHPLQPASTHS